MYLLLFLQRKKNRQQKENSFVQNRPVSFWHTDLAVWHYSTTHKLGECCTQGGVQS